MHVTNSRVTNASTYRNFTSSVNNVHLALNKSMNKVSSGERYESAAESPISYYTGQRIDTQYQDVISKKSLLKDVQNRIYQQELGARDIQNILGGEGGAKNKVQYARTATTVDYALESTRQDLLQKSQEIVNDLNIQYENFYIYGGNDISTAPFSLSADGKQFTYKHTFSGDSEPTEFVMNLTKQTDGSYKFVLDESGTNGKAEDLLKAMQEQGRIDIGYGSIKDRSTLLDTYTGGMNLLTGITSDRALNSSEFTDSTGQPVADLGDKLMNALSKGPLGLVCQSVWAMNDYIDVAQNSDGDADKVEEARGILDDVLGQTIEDMTMAEQSVSSFYADLGNKYRLIDNMDDRLGDLKISLETQYKDKLGADPYESIMEMFNNQYSYNAALQVGSKLMSSSLFDFVG
ncbi:MAG: flagellar hook-basal body protein [Hungatella sp.]|nr:flagellar hook-basal body protein [Hungatella sp.]